MSVLLDANILLRLGDRDSPQHDETVRAIVTLHASDVDCVLVPQTLYEYWVVATRPLENNGLGLTAPAADALVDRWIGDFRLKLDERGVYSHWRELVVKHNVVGKPAHDARLVAAMRRHGLTNLLTHNARDFRRYEWVSVFSPSDVNSGVLPR